VLGRDLVRDGGVDERKRLHILASLVGRLPDRIRHAARFSDAKPHSAVVVPDDDRYTERKSASAFYDLGHAGDVDDALVQLLSIVGAVSITISSHYVLPSTAARLFAILSAARAAL
jgi:hypothetical protein